MRHGIHPSIKRSLCGLLAVLMSLQGLIVAGSVASDTMVIDAVPAVAAASNDESMPCHDMMSNAPEASIPQTDAVGDADCDGDCCTRDHGCGMAYCLAGSCLPATVFAAAPFMYTAATTLEFPSPAMGLIATAHGPPLRPPIA